jgi:hypothetical protein
VSSSVRMMRVIFMDSCSGRRNKHPQSGPSRQSVRYAFSGDEGPQRLCRGGRCATYDLQCADDVWLRLRQKRRIFSRNCEPFHSPMAQGVV